jgi:shikimate dehydrogenase
MTFSLSGATRVHFIVGDPIAQVKSPAGVSQAFQEAGLNAVCVPAHVSAPDLAAWHRGVSLQQNVDGIIVTVPHKFAYAGLCDSLSERARFLGGVNTLRRRLEGGWHGDMFDGLGFVEAMLGKGCKPRGRRALLAGAGGAGSAIAYELVMSGVSELAIHDPDEARREGLIARLAGLGRTRVVGGSADPVGFDIVINATPLGMKPGDPLPIDASRFSASQFVGCVITMPAVSPLVEAARAKGCSTLVGTDMFARVRDLMVDFLMGK